MVGSWDVKVSVSGMPQKVATAVSKLSETLVGAEYTPIAYLGSQVVNGTNHAVLAEQLVVTGKDVKNIVVLIFNEKPGEMEATLVNIERVVEGGGELGGFKVDPQTEIPAEAKEAFDAVFADRVGVKVEPFALLGTQVTKGVDYIFAATVAPVALDAVTTVEIVVVNALIHRAEFIDVLASRTGLGYAFTWLRK